MKTIEIVNGKFNYLLVISNRCLIYKGVTKLIKYIK